MKIKTGAIPWRCDTNWIVAAHGSVKSSIIVESSSSPISESEPQTMSHRSPVVLKPPSGPDSGPCYIKICFEQKYEICQIYVRSTAHVYEVYYANSLQGSDEYLCTVRCGVAERDEKLLQTTCIEDVAEEHREYASGELTEETVTDGRNIPTSEDDWVKIKVPEDLYEATAQISDADPCSSLTIRLLSLQDKGHLYVDEIYVFVDPVESTGSGNEAVLASSSAQSSLMAMLVPTLLQLSKSGASQVQEQIDSKEVLKDYKMETRSSKTNQIDVEKESNKVDQHYVKSKEHEDDRGNSVELQQPNLAVSMKQHLEPIHVNDLPHGYLEKALEQLISRVSRVEDICLKFEQRILKPIENMEARLQQVENQLEKLAKNSQEFGLPHCTRICAPEFTCSESNSTLLYNDRNDNPPSGSDLPRDSKFQPSLVVTAPEFSCGEDEAQENDDLEPFKEPCIKPKKKLSANDALAAALSGFLSTAKFHSLSKVDEENQHQGQAESCQSNAQECSDTETGNMESSQYIEILTVKAPDFPVEEIVDVEKNLNYVTSSSDMACANEEKSNDNEMVPPTLQSKSLITSAESCDFIRSPDNGHLNERSEFNTLNSSVEGETGNDSGPALAKGSVETGESQVYGETNPRKAISCNSDVEDIETKKVLGHESESVSGDVQTESESSCASLLDFEFPILEVKFTSDVSGRTKTPLEALLGGAAESNIEAPSVHDSGDDTGSSEQANVGNESSDLLPSNDLLVDFGYSSADGCSNLEDESQSMCTPSSPELNVSLEDSHSGTPKELSLAPVICSKCKGKCSWVRQPGSSMIYQVQLCCSDYMITCKDIDSNDLSVRPQHELENFVSEESKDVEGATDMNEDTQGGVQCAQQ